MTDLRTLKAGSGTVATDIFNAVIDAILGGLRFTASNVDSGAAPDGQVLTADGAGGASWEAGGGSSPVQSHTVTVTSAQILALDMTPVTLVAGVAGMILIPISVTSVGGGDTVTLYVVNGQNFLTWDAVASSLSFGVAKFDSLLQGGNDTGGDVGIDVPSGLASVFETQARSVGKGLILSASGGANTTGDFDVDVTVLYQAVTVS